MEMTISARALAGAAAATCVALAQGCCGPGTHGCCGGDDVSGISLALAQERPHPELGTVSQETVIRWSEEIPVRPSDHFTIAGDEGTALPADLLVLEQEDGTPVPFPSEASSPGDTDESCAHEERRYQLDELEAGRFVLVLRRRDDQALEPNNCGSADCPWTTHDGAEALVATLVVSPDAPFSR